MVIKKLLLLSGFILAFGALAQAQDFVYRPVNPAFGGNYLNYQWMLSSAQAQSDFKEETPERDPFSRDPLADFEASLSRQILNQISRQLTVDQFGDGPLTEGQYAFGNYEIEVSPGLEGLVIYILDTATGNETTITIPNF
ncbi:MAG: curli production assembly/transport component CsgF [Bacteroidota bacterium]